MSLRLRVIDSRRTFIVVLRSRHGETYSRLVWVAVHRQKKPWAETLSRALDLLMEEPMVHDGICFAGDGGKIIWQTYAFWTIIRLEVTVYSRNKRRLITAALLKAARNGW
jgi:hypothetical protein